MHGNGMPVKVALSRSTGTLREPLAAAARLPLSEAFPVYAWALENAVQRLGGAAQARTTLRPLFDALADITELAPRLEENAAARALRAARAARKASRPGAADPLVRMRIDPGDRAAAERVLRAWCAAHPSRSLLLSDRFFSPEELPWVRLLAEAMPSGCRITVLTSRHGQAQAKVPTPWEQAYRLHWRLRVAESAPPPVEIVILGTERGGQAPFHDRRLIAPGRAPASPSAGRSTRSEGRAT
jgi:hypothetical protein